MSQKLKNQQRRIRQVLSILLAVLLIGSVSYIGVKYFNSSKAATAGSMYLTPDNATANNWAQNTEVTVQLRENSGTSAINTMQAFLNYDPSQLQFLALTESGEFDFVPPAAPTCTPLSTASPACQPTQGAIHLHRGLKSAGATTTGDHGIVTLKFKVLAASGTAAITIDKPNSSISGIDGVEVLQTVGNGSYIISAPIVQDAIFSIDPASGTIAKDSNLAVTIRLKSPTQKVFSVHSVLNYPASQLEYVSTDPPGASDPFVNDPQTLNSAGTIDLIRAVGFGSTGFQGDGGAVATVRFKVIGAPGAVPLSFKRSSTSSLDTGAYDGRGKNILGTASSASFTIPAPPDDHHDNPPVTPPVDTTKPPVVNGTTKYKATTTGKVTVKGNTTQVQGNVEIAPLTDPEILAQNPGDSIVKVEYYIGKKLVATKNSEPYSYTIDTKKYRNGTYDMTVKTYYSSGTVDSQTQKLVVKNPVTLTYIMAHYGAGILGSILGLLIVAALLWKFVLPRFGGNNGPASEYAGYGGLSDPDMNPGYNEYEAPSESVITPTTPSPDSDYLDPEQTAATQSTPPLTVETSQTYTPAQPAQPVTPAAPVAPTTPPQPPTTPLPPTQPPVPPQPQ
jgi:hypothetical protein